ncbi:hypothetical protein pv_265 [Pithovirus sibericum]|uniref:Uncharacterized protein n=1 Tax=Pithovirus sibericum TaxID=1450746 RepID=W5S674_9VIRU|nr:hypothetical protein pv_265 [Pithovirus sibericum]AHH01832.1 hypothetical protein pv_265 [Pithovirus sibericum]
METVRFWSEIIREHMLFLAYLLDLPGNEQRRFGAVELEQEWANLLKFQSEIPVQQFLNLSRRTLILKEDVLAASNQFELSSKLPQQQLSELLRHMIEELLYFEAIFTGTITPQQELSFLARESAEHDKLALETLLNPPVHIQRQIELGVHRLFQQSESPNCDLLKTLDDSNQTGREIKLQIQHGELTSIVPLVMLNHELREGEWARERIHQIQQQCPSPYSQSNSEERRISSHPNSIIQRFFSRD